MVFNGSYGNRQNRFSKLYFKQMETHCF